MKLCIDDDNIILASFPIRLVAYLIDLIIINICFLFMKIPLVFVKLFAPNIIIFKTILFNFTLVDIFFYILSSAYFILTVYCNGATIGKTLMNIKVISTNNKLTLFNIIYRETIGRYLSSILYIGYILIFINKDKKALHDILSNTQVVYDKNNFKVIPVYKKEVNVLDETQINNDEFIKQDNTITVDKNTIETEIHTDDNDNQS